jgi:Flp pilus assembly protein TadG
MTTMTRRLVDDDRGAEALEFALVFPVVIFLILAILYGLFAVAAQASLSHAASRTVRYASIPTDPVYGVYRTPDEVNAYFRDQAPLFAKSTCTTNVTGDTVTNAPVVVAVSCNFPNPAGRALNGLKDVFFGTTGDGTYSDDLTMTARAEGRRE